MQLYYYLTELILQYGNKGTLILVFLKGHSCERPGLMADVHLLALLSLTERACPW